MKQKHFDSNVINIEYGPWYCEDINVDIENETMEIILNRDIKKMEIQFDIIK